jgi:glycosyltransferase involved in cell wall biosynthesis
MKKVLHLIESMGQGGAETLLVGIINELADFEHHLIILNSPETLQASIHTPHKFNNLNISSWKQLFLKRKSIRRYIRENQIDIVHSHLYRANILARISTPKNVLQINSIHTVSSLDNYNVRRISLYLERLTYHKDIHIIAVSRTVLNDFDKWISIRGRKTVLYNFIQNQFFNEVVRRQETNKFKMIAVGNLRHQKNYHYLIESFKSLPHNISLDIYGEGALRETLQKEIDAYGLNIRLCGTHKEMHNILAKYDAFVMPSFFEGQPLSLLEAMASGLPAFLSDIPELKEVAGNAAVYFDINDPADFVKQLKKMVSQSETLIKLAREAKDIVSKLSAKKIYMKRLAEVYELPAIQRIFK